MNKFRFGDYFAERRAVRRLSCGDHQGVRPHKSITFQHLKNVVKITVNVNGQEVSIALSKEHLTSMVRQRKIF